MARNTYENDEILEDKFDAKQLKRLGGYIRPYTGKMLLVLFLMLSSSGLTMFIPRFFDLDFDRSSDRIVCSSQSAYIGNTFDAGCTGYHSSDTRGSLCSFAGTAL